eukprot:CAMPEP_0171319862 /NCGR_PEP_ID=MMETSP0816-20121228/99826_1 /TAXON_ID=420281 /ORGANISM="Proboscia inermis, Strain CCAP1064/1" /LENGTH=69 /DNA_ID=CAMNT_0011816037 /DNA_START=64 /DNA_END=270 /DNA_ORIENTATION=+
MAAVIAASKRKATRFLKIVQSKSFPSSLIRSAITTGCGIIGVAVAGSSLPSSASGSTSSFPMSDPEPLS